MCTMLPGVPCSARRARDGLRRQERRVEVEPHDVVERLGRCREHRAPPVQQTARDVHEPVERPQLGGGLADGARDLVGLAEVGDQRHDPAVDRGDGLLGGDELLATEVDRADGDARLGEHPADRRPDPSPTGAGDDDRLAAQPEPVLDRLLTGGVVYTSRPASTASASAATKPTRHGRRDRRRPRPGTTDPSPCSPSYLRRTGRR